MTEYAGTDNLEVMAEAVNYNRYLLDLIRGQARHGDTILDVGAGIGTFARALAAEGYAVRCVEPDARQAAMIAAHGLPVATALDEVADGSIDYLYSLNVLEHIADDTAALREWAAKLKRGGRMLLYVPAFQLLYSSMDRKVGHCRRYAKRELATKAAQAGMRVTDVRYADCLGFFASLAYKAFGDRSGSIDRGALRSYDRFVFPLSRVGDALLDPLLGKNVVLAAVRI
jgi:SAM-dependent methyltransferase